MIELLVTIIVWFLIIWAIALVVGGLIVILSDNSYKSPEETIQWERTMRTLIKHIPIPKEDWEFNVLSIFTTRSIENLKTEAKEEKYWRV